MSLVCDETGRDIEFGDPLMVGTRNDVEEFSALSQEVLKKIPQNLKRESSCDPAMGGVDIHVAVSKKNFNGSYTWSVGFKKGDFLYSISQKTAEKYLPKHIKKYPEPLGLFVDFEIRAASTLTK